MSVTLERPSATPQTDTAAETDPFVAPRFRWTRESVARAYEAGVFPPDIRYELIDGELVQQMPEDPQHVEGLEALQETLAHTIGLSTCFLRAQHPLILGETFEPLPDLAVIRGQRRDYTGRHPSAEDALLVIEVSRTTLPFDKSVKAEAYARAGIPEYWILNLVKRRLEVHRDPREDGYQSLTFVRADETVTPLFAPEKAVAVSGLLPIAAVDGE